MNGHAAFSVALLNTQSPCPQGLVSHDGDIESRFAVYRNNVQSGFINALTVSFPVVSQLVGAEFFQAMAQVFVQKHPPDNPVMSTYGSPFAHFIERFAPALSVPYLADVARLERLCIQSFHAADALPVTLESLAETLNTPQSLDQLCLHLHPSVLTLDSSYAVVSIWTAHQHPLQLPEFDPDPPQSALVVRNGLSVEVFAVSSASVAFIRAVQAGCALGLAANKALQVEPGFDVGQLLALLITHGAITDLQPNNN